MRKDGIMNADFIEARQNSFNLGAVGVGSTSGAVTAYFNFASSANPVTLNTTPYQVLTQGQTGLDFADARNEGTSGCAAAPPYPGNNYIGGGVNIFLESTCIVNVNFTPEAAGTRYGAVELLNSNNPSSVIATAYVYGTGTGPQLMYIAPQSDVMSTLNSTFGSPEGLAVEVNSSGSAILVADAKAGAVYDVVGGASNNIATLVAPTGVAVDGAGNAFVADPGGPTVSEIPYNGSTWGTAVPFISLTKGGSSFTFTSPTGVAVDASGNIFVADNMAPGVYEILAASGYTIVTQLASGFPFSAPGALAVDGSGNLYIADTGKGALYELTAVSNYAAPSGALVSNLISPTGVAVDGSGNVFFISAGDLEELPVGGTIITLATSLTAPYGVAVDGNRNVYIDTDSLPSGNPVLKLDYADLPTLIFASTPYLATSSDSPQSVVVENVGTGSGSAVTFSANPAVTTTTTGADDTFALDDPTTTCSSTTTLNDSSAGSTCTVDVDFTPQAIGAIAGTLILADSLPSSPQTINLLGTGIQATQTITFTTPAPSTAVYNSTFPVAASSSSGLAVVLTVDAASSAVCSISSGTVTITGGTGTCTIDANQAGNTNYIAATQVQTSATAAKTTPTVSWSATPPASAAYNSQFTVVATSNSTGAITYTTSGGCSNIAGVVTMTSGTTACMVSASAAADANYTAGSVGPTSVTASLASQATLTVNATSPVAYNTQQTLTTAGGSGTGAVSYSVGGSTACTVSGATLSISGGTGTCAVTATKAGDANYQSITSAAATLTVQLAAQVIAFSPPSPVTYGATPITLSATGGASGNQVTFSLVSGPATLSGSILTVFGIGTITINANQTGNANYAAATQVTQSIVVNQAALTVAANNATKIYGTANPSFTGGVTGAVNGDSFAESFSTSATINSNAGNYAIVPGATGTNLADYSMTIQDGTLTILQAPTTISLSASNASINPGQGVTLTAQVASTTTGTPTGSVSFYDGTALLGTATLSGGTTSFTSNTLSGGTTHQLTAVYGGDSNFTSSSTPGSTSIVVAALDFLLTSMAPVAQTVDSGSAVTFQVVVAPLYGVYAGPVTFSATGLPSNATIVFTPQTVAVNAGQQTVTATIQTASATAALQPAPLSRRTHVPLALALVLLPLLGVRRLRRNRQALNRMLYLLVVLLGGAVSMILSGCGGQVSSSQKVQTYRVTIGATSGNLQHSTIVTLTVQ